MRKERNNFQLVLVCLFKIQTRKAVINNESNWWFYAFSSSSSKNTLLVGGSDTLSEDVFLNTC